MAGRELTPLRDFLSTFRHGRVHANPADPGSCCRHGSPGAWPPLPREVEGRLWFSIRDPGPASLAHLDHQAVPNNSELDTYLCGALLSEHEAQGCGLDQLRQLGIGAQVSKSPEGMGGPFTF